jgi:hypothetical protein
MFIFKYVNFMIVAPIITNNKTYWHCRNENNDFVVVVSFSDSHSIHSHPTFKMNLDPDPKLFVGSGSGFETGL